MVIFGFILIAASLAGSILGAWIMFGSIWEKIREDREAEARYAWKRQRIDEVERSPKTTVCLDIDQAVKIVEYRPCSNHGGFDLISRPEVTIWCDANLSALPKFIELDLKCYVICATEDDAFDFKIRWA